MVRAGADGAYAHSSEWQGWVPAFHNSLTGGARDVTGGGNAFMGGMLAGMLLTGDLRAGESPLHIQISRSVHLRLGGRVVCHRATRHSTALKGRWARAVEWRGSLGAAQEDGGWDRPGGELIINLTHPPSAPGSPHRLTSASHASHPGLSPDARPSTTAHSLAKQSTASKDRRRVHTVATYTDTLHLRPNLLRLEARWLGNKVLG